MTEKLTPEKKIKIAAILESMAKFVSQRVGKLEPYWVSNAIKGILNGATLSISNGVVYIFIIPPRNSSTDWSADIRWNGMYFNLSHISEVSAVTPKIEALLKVLNTDG